MKNESIKNKYRVEPIPKEHTYDWLLNKHYAKRIPGIISYCFGLYDKTKTLQGVCVFGLGNRVMNDGDSVFNKELKIRTLELQRLVINEGMEKGVLSFFVSKCLMQLPKPMCIYSYADSNVGHHGYIYQATNWIYTGMSTPRTTFLDTRTGEYIHERTLSGVYGTSSTSRLPKYIEIGKEEGGKYRYFFFLGDKKQIEEMKMYFSYKILPYPKGENNRYDASYKPTTMKSLF